MFDISRIKKYFEYEDRLRTIVSIVTGILIAIYNLISGVMISQLITFALLGLNEYSILTFFLISVPGVLIGALIFKAEIFLINLFTGSIIIEEYSYLRLVLFVSIITYIIISVIYSLFMVSDSLIKKFFPF